MESPAPQKARPPGTLGAAAAGAGSALVAVLASSCCVPILAPLIVAVLGAGGAAWAGLKPYSPYLLGGSLLLLLYGLWTVYRPRPDVRGLSSGASELQTTWLEKDGSANVAVYVIWSSQSGAKERNVADAASLVADRRTRHY